MAQMGGEEYYEKVGLELVGLTIVLEAVWLPSGSEPFLDSGWAVGVLNSTG